MNKKEIGGLAEKYTKNYLIGKKYKIIDTNWTCHWGEIDIIAKKDEELVFVEVKFRNSDLFGFPHESFTKKKKVALVRAIYKYLAINNKKDHKWRLDLITIIKKPEFKLEHYKSVEV